MKKRFAFLKNINFWNILILISSVFFAQFVVLDLYDGVKFYYIFTIITTILINSFILFKWGLLKRIKEHVREYKILDVLMALIFSIQSSKVLVRYFSYNVSVANNLIIKIGNFMHFEGGNFRLMVIAIMQLFAIIFLFFVWYSLIVFLLPKIKKFFQGLSKKERLYLVISNVLFVVLAIFINIKTTVFAYPHNSNGNVVLYDVLYTTDTGYQINNDSFQNLASKENDLRQPLFAVFSYPFAQVAELVCSTFEIIPRGFLYPLILIIIQGLLLSICSILLSRVCTNGKDNLLFMFGFNSIYATLFFALNIEQYVFGIFYLILLVYTFLNKRKVSPLLFSSVAGCLMTNVVFLPFILSRKNIKEYIKEGIKYGMIFVILIILFGQTFNIVSNLLNFNKFTHYMGETVTFLNKLYQFIYFIPSCFIAPSASTNMFMYDHISYLTNPINSISILGLILIIGIILSFILNFKKNNVKLSFMWFIYSFIILCVVGWGTMENSLVLYACYFGWAYYILLYELLNTILKKHPKCLMIVLVVLIAIFLFFNIRELIEIIDFGCKYYPFRL